MAWRKSLRTYVRIVVMLVVLTNQPMSVQSQNQADSVWTTEQWQRATQGLEYKPKEEKKKEEEEVDPIQIDEENDSKSFGQWLAEFLTGALGKFIVIILVFVLLLLIILRVMNGKVRNRDSTVKEALGFALRNIEDDLENAELNSVIDEAEKAEDYKTAVRLHYLGVIKELHTQQIIRWKKDKTNRDYLNEVREKAWYADFRDLTLAYEIVWYGDTTIGVPEYTTLKKVFDRFNQQITNGAKH